MIIKTLKMTNFIGIDELNYNPGMLNIFEGVKGSGKSSILEGIEKTISNNNRRTEVIRHGADESTLFIETDTGLEVDRRIRNEKADYLKLRQKGEGIKSTETELRKLVSGDIFRPLDFITMDAKKQTEIILGMIKMNYTDEEINGWFGQDVLSNVNTSKHLLQVLKDIEVRNFKQREEVNREIKLLEGQVKGIESELPPNYDGKEWQELKIQEYYNKVSEAEKINNAIIKANELRNTITEKIESLKINTENNKRKIGIKFTEQRQYIKDIIESTKGKIEKSNNVINSSADKLEIEQNKSTLRMNEEIEEIKRRYSHIGIEIVKEINKEINEQKEVININNNKISAKEQELLSVSELEKQELKAEEQQLESLIENENSRVGIATEWLKTHKEIEVEPLQIEADKVAKMQSYLREWDRMLEIRNNKLASSKFYSDSLTKIIETARNKPSELLKQHTLPIDGISVDENSMIRINGILLDGLSDGEKLEAAIKIALQRMGEFKVLCLDGMEKLNKSEQKKIIELCESTEEREAIQIFATITNDNEDGKFEIKGGL
jgi:exonuclease SbcC